MFDFLCYQPSDSFIPKPGPAAFLRFLNASPFSKRVDVYSNGHLIAKNIGFRKFTPYLTVPSGQHNISIFPSGKRSNMITYKNIVLEAGFVCTIAMEGLASFDLFLIPEPMINKKADSANIRFVNLSPDEALDIAIPGFDNMFLNIKYKDITEYITLLPNKYTLQIKSSETGKILVTVPDVVLKEEWNYTIFTLGLIQGKPGLQVLTPLDGNTYIKVN